MKAPLQQVLFIHPNGRIRKVLTRWEPYVKSNGMICLDHFGFPAIKGLVRDGSGSFWSAFSGNRLFPIA